MLWVHRGIHNSVQNGQMEPPYWRGSEPNVQKDKSLSRAKNQKVNRIEPCQLGSFWDGYLDWVYSPCPPSKNKVMMGRFNHGLNSQNPDLLNWPNPKILIYWTDLIPLTFYFFFSFFVFQEKSKSKDKPYHIIISRFLPIFDIASK